MGVSKVKPFEGQPLRVIPAGAGRSAARIRLAEAIAAQAQIRAAELDVRHALTSAERLSAAAARALQDCSEAAEAAADALAAQLTEAAARRAEPPAEVAVDTEAAAALAKAQAQADAALAARQKLAADLSLAKEATAEATRAVDKASQLVFLDEADDLITEGLAAQETLIRVQNQLWSLDRTGGHVGEMGFRPFPIPMRGVGLIRTYNPPLAAMQAELNRWRRYRLALASRPDAQIGDDLDDGPDAA